MSKARRRKRHLALVRWCHKLPTSPAKPPLGYYYPRMFTAPLGVDTALARACGRAWRDVTHRGDPWVWVPRR